MFEQKIVSGNSSNLDERLAQANVDGSWQVVCATQDGLTITVILERRRRAVPTSLSEDTQTNSMLQAVAYFCHCEQPLGFIGSKKCRRCDKIIGEN